MLLPSQAIRVRCTGPAADLIDPFKEDNLRPSSYDLTIGEEFYVGQDFSGTKLSTEELGPDQAFWIPPHAVCFILSAEKLHLPQDISAKVSLRMNYIYAGLVLGAQPPFDPGYQGRAIVMLHNLSSQPVSMRRGERLATIEFLSLWDETADPRTQNKVKTIAALLQRPLTSSLSDIARQSADAKSQVQQLVGQMLTFAALIVAVLAVPGLLSFTNLVDRLEEQKNELAQQKTQLDEYKKTLEVMQARLEKQAGATEGQASGKPGAPK